MTFHANEEVIILNEQGEEIYRDLYFHAIMFIYSDGKKDKFPKSQIKPSKDGILRLKIGSKFKDKVATSRAIMSRVMNDPLAFGNQKMFPVFSKDTKRIKDLSKYLKQKNKLWHLI